MKKLLLMLCMVLAMPTFAQTSLEQAQNKPTQELVPAPQHLTSQSNFLDNHPYADIIVQSEINASPNAQKVLVAARNMVEQGAIIKGGCWDYLNAAWNKAGFDSKKRQALFKGDLKKPPYANIDDIQAGDWLYHVNYGYNGIEHSGMFVGWIDKANAIGLTLSYAGERRGEPARYKAYDLSGVYRITRVK